MGKLFLLPNTFYDPVIDSLVLLVLGGGVPHSAGVFVPGENVSVKGTRQ